MKNTYLLKFGKQFYWLKNNYFQDQNLNTFKKLWADNADSKIFELKNVFDNPNMSKEEIEQWRNNLITRVALSMKTKKEPESNPNPPTEE